MTIMQNFLPFLLLVPFLVGAQTPRVNALPRENTCGRSQLLGELGTTEGVALLKAYGYDWKEPWACTKIESTWATRATILRFRKVTAQTDEATAFSVLQVAGSEHIWVLPTDAGMLEVPHSESDPHNIAAFNRLLQLHKGAVDAAGWLDLGKLYLTILNHQNAVAIKAEADDGGSCSSAGDCSVSFSDRPVVAGETYNKWVLDFTGPSHGKSIVLTEVSRETVRLQR